MLHSKLATMRLGLTTTTAVINTVNRLQFVIEASANGSIPTVGYIARRYQHVLSAKPLMINTSNENARCHSIFNKTPTSIGRNNVTFTGLRLISTQEITKHITILSDQKKNVEKDATTLRLKTELDKPLVVLLQWLMAKPNHIKKYAELYIEQGYDVMAVSVTPWQVMWPTKGTQIAAAEVLKFLENNVTAKNPLILHGFSVGGYLWGECMVQMARDIERYRQVLDMIQGQIWDSAVELSEIPLGVPKAMFPKNTTLQLALKNYLIYHMKTFHEPATSHYIRASQMFHSTLVKKPALLLLSNSDPIGSVSANKVLKQSYESSGIRCEWKCWDESLHVAHFQKYRDEYIHTLNGFLQSLNVQQQQQQQEPEAMRARI